MSRRATRADFFDASEPAAEHNVMRHETPSRLHASGTEACPPMNSSEEQKRNNAMNRPTKGSLPVSALVTILAAFAIPARAEGAVARVPVVQENSTDPDLKAIFDNARNRGGQIINLFLLQGNAPKLAS